MTLRDLSEYRKLLEHLERNEQILTSLRTAAGPGAQVLTGMPHAPGVRDKVGDYAIEIADMEERIRHQKEKVKKSEADIEAYIDGIDDGYLKTAFRLRFIRGLAWSDVTDAMGYESEESIRRAVYRYIKFNS